MGIFRTNTLAALLPGLLCAGAYNDRRDVVAARCNTMCGNLTGIPTDDTWQACEPGFVQKNCNKTCSEDCSCPKITLERMMKTTLRLQSTRANHGFFQLTWVNMSHGLSHIPYAVYQRWVPTESRPMNFPAATALASASSESPPVAGIQEATARTPPNLVFVLVDDLGWNDIGMHDARVLTPRLDELASSGVVLERHYVYRYCSPTRGSFLSGRLPHHDHQANPGGSSAWLPNINMTLLPTKLKTVGYRTAMRGKWHYGFASAAYLPIARGFDDHAGYLQGACDHITEATGCGVDSWRSNATHSGPDTRNGTTSYDSYRHASDMVAIIKQEDPRPLFLYAALHVAHEPLEAPAPLISMYAAAEPTWCKSKATIAAMATVADDTTGVLVDALKATRGMWSNTVLVFSSDNGGDSGCSSNYPLRGRKRTFFEGGCRVPAFLASPLLPEARRGGRLETAFIHISDWYATFLGLAGVVDNPTDSGPGRFDVDGKNIWPYLRGAADGSSSSSSSNSNAHRQSPTPPPPPPPLPPRRRNGVLVLGFNYSTLRISGGGGYGPPSGALIEVETGYKLIVGTQDSAADTLSWDTADYPCGTRTNAGVDCTPHCLYNVRADPSERHELSQTASNPTPTANETAALARLLAAYDEVGGEAGMPNTNDREWNEQGTPYDPAACKIAARTGYWQPWL